MVSGQLISSCFLTFAIRLRVEEHIKELSLRTGLENFNYPNKDICVWHKFQLFYFRHRIAKKTDPIVNYVRKKMKLRKIILCRKF